MFFVDKFVCGIQCYYRDCLKFFAGKMGKGLSSTLFTICFLLLSGVLHAETPVVVNGVLDLRKYSFNDIVYLQGKWKFKPLTDSGLTIGSKEYDISVPGSWDAVTGNTFARGEYSLKILMPKNSPPNMGLYFPEISQAVEVEVNGRLIYSSGSLKTGETDYTIFSMPISIKDEMDIRIGIRNSQFRKGGLVYLPMIGLNKKIRKLREQKIWLEAFWTGILILATIYNFLLFYYDPSRHSALWLGISSFFMVVRGMMTGENTIHFLMPWFPWALDYHIEYICSYLIGGSFLLFAERTFPSNISSIRKSVYVVSVLSGVFSLVSVFLPIKILSQSLIFLQTFLLLCACGGLFIFLFAFYQRRKGSFFFPFLGIIFLAGFCIDFVYYNGGSKFLFNLTQVGMVFFVIFQTVNLARLHSDSFIRVKELSCNLEKEVAKQTEGLKHANDLLMEEVDYRKQVESRLEMLSTTDPLTGAANRLKITPHLEQAYRLFDRYGKSFGLIMMDIDYFKDVNDHYGHSVGDDVLKKIVIIAERSIREVDIFARWGGEEFLIYLPEMDLESSLVLAERLRLAIGESHFPVVGNITASFGVAVPLEGEVMLKDILKRVDDNLYEAKNNGRNCVVG